MAAAGSASRQPPEAASMAAAGLIGRPVAGSAAPALPGEAAPSRAPDARATLLRAAAKAARAASLPTYPQPAVQAPSQPQIRRPLQPQPQAAASPPKAATLARHLLDEGAVPPDVLRRALAEGGSDDLGASLCATGALTPQALAAACARWQGLQLLDPTQTHPDVGLIDRLGAQRCLRLGVLPLGRRAGRTVVGFVDPQAIGRLQPELEALFGPVCPAIVAAPALEQALWLLRRDNLRQIAETRVCRAESCRQFRAFNPLRLILAAAAVVVATIMLAPGKAVAALVLWAVVVLAATLMLRVGALIAALKAAPAPPAPPAPVDVGAPDIPLPVISLIVPLYREQDIAPRLLRRLGRLDYPRARLDVILAVEESDGETRAALLGARLPGWMRVVTVPDGPLRTKPRALNYALPFCRGSIIGIYDAEDAPARDQLRKVVAHFAARGPKVACLQGVLDYYNPATNWLARCFTLEYAIWFRLIMPGLQRLGIPLPLGGTTLFLRREVIEDLGAWDAHNVTEDADLGIRLAVHGYRTEMLDSTTEEEANCRARPWVRQRTRWIKGHMLTWAVHMRDPVRLWRALGPVGFLGYQVVFLGAQSQFLLAPVLWSFWLVALGLGHPVQATLPPPVVMGILGLVVLAEALSILLAVLAGRRTRHVALWRGAPFLHIYFPMASVAAWLALHEALTRPHYWAKTSHGHFDQATPARTTAAAADLKAAGTTRMPADRGPVRRAAA